MPIELTKENMQEEIHSEIPVLIDFWAPWCGPCQMMAPIFEELADEYEGKVKFAKVNTDENQDLAAPYGIQGIPTLIMLSKGEEVDRMVGFLPKEQMKQKIDEMLSKL